MIQFLKSGILNYLSLLKQPNATRNPRIKSADNIAKLERNICDEDYDNINLKELSEETGGKDILWITSEIFQVRITIWEQKEGEQEKWFEKEEFPELGEFLLPIHIIWENGDISQSALVPPRGNARDTHSSGGTMPALGEAHIHSLPLSMSMYPYIYIYIVLAQGFYQMIFIRVLQQVFKKELMIWMKRI